MFVVLCYWELQHSFDLVAERLRVLWMLTESVYREHEKLARQISCVENSSRGPYRWQLMRGGKEHRDHLLHHPFDSSLILGYGCFDDPGDPVPLGRA